MSAELFKVICVTCQAKLSVRNESLIGQIVACPRCQSMVEVARPAAAAAAITASVESTINLPAAAVPSPDADPETPVDAAPADAPTEQPTEAMVDSAAAALEASAAVGKYQVLVWSLASFFVGAVLVGAVLYRRGVTTDAEPANPAVETISETSADEVTTSSEDQVASESVVAPTADETTSPLETATVEVATDDTVDEPISDDVTPTDAIAAEPTDVEVVTEQLTTESSEPTPTMTVEPAPRLARRFDPLDLDPESLSLATVDHPSTPENVAEEPADEQPVDESPSADNESLAAKPLAVRLGSESDSAASNREAQSQLNLKIPRLKVDQMPLVDVLRLLSQLSGVPVSAAPDQLLMAGITPKKQVSLDVQDASLGATLAELLDPLRLTYEAQGAQVVIVRQEASKWREINYPIDDLVVPQTSEDKLAGWIQQLVAPATWQSTGGTGILETNSGSLKIAQTQDVHYQVLVFLERLRLARNLPPKSRFPVKRLVGQPAPLAVEERLAAPTTFTFSHFTSLEEVFAHWQAELALPLLVDWPTLAKSDIWPATTVSCAIIAEPWHTALDQTLTPIGLGWRATTGGAIEITTANNVQTKLQLEVYELRKLNEGEHEQLRETLGQLTTQNIAGAIQHDPVSDALLCLQPAVAQRTIFGHLRRAGLIAIE